jgi:hypothetical protein
MSQSAFSKPKPLSGGHNCPIEILSGAQKQRQLIQDFCPFPESIEWELGQQYFREQGSSAFIKDSFPVPFVVNNDGNLSLNAANVFFASLLEADETGTLDPEIRVLELGIGGEPIWSREELGRGILDKVRTRLARHLASSPPGSPAT